MVQKELVLSAFHFSFVDDIVKLAEYLKSSIVSISSTIEDYTAYRRMVLLVLARLISYNRRRPGEVQALR